MQNSVKSRKTSPIVIIYLDDQSLKKIAQPWPWKRSIFAKALKNLATQNPKVIGLDFLFTEKREGIQDYIFSSTLKNISKKIPIILGKSFYYNQGTENIKNSSIKYLEKGLLMPLIEFKKYTSSGFLNFPLDADGFIRRAAIIQNYEKEKIFSFSLVIIMKYLNILSSQINYQPAQFLQIKEKIIHLNRNNSVNINYNKNLNYFRKISFFQIYENDIPPKFFQDKIVLIGSNFLGSKDTYFTPIKFKENITKIPGVLIHANIINNLLNNSFFITSSFSYQVFLIVLINIFMISFFIFRLRLLFLWIGNLLTLFSYIIFSYLMFSHTKTYYDTFIIILNILISTVTLTLIAQFIKIYIQAKALKTIYKLKNKHSSNRKILYEHKNNFEKYGITKREKEVLLLIIRGYTNNEIAKKLFISYHTVRRHLANMYDKTAINDRKTLINRFKV